MTGEDSFLLCSSQRNKFENDVFDVGWIGSKVIKEGCVGLFVI